MRNCAILSIPKQAKRSMMMRDAMMHSRRKDNLDAG
jgi:hypothetical protein